VRVQILDSQLELTVSDNGQGFEPEQARRDLPRTHFGLEIMRERAEAIGATFSLESRPAAGASIKVQLPIREGA
jgi:signal transduction histidine kinase